MNTTQTSATTRVTSDMPTSVATGDGIDLDTGGRIALSVIILSLSIMSVVGNILVCIVIHRSRRLQSTTNYYITSLAVCDLIVTTCVIPFVVAELIENRWSFGVVMCKLVRFLQYWMLAASTWILACMSEDRYYTIVYPLSPHISHSRTLKLLAICFTLPSFVVSLPALYLHDLHDVNGRHDYCSSVAFSDDTSAFGKSFIVVYCVIVALVPVIGIVYFYLRLFRYIWQPGQAGRTLQRTMNSVPRSKVTTLKMIMIATAVVVALLLPFVACHLWQLSLPGNSTLTSYYTFFSVTIVYFLTCSSKPALYMRLNRNFRRGCREVFCMSAMKCYRNNIYTITNTSSMAKKNHVGFTTDTATSSRTSPSRTFDRSARMQDTFWPVHHAAPSSFMYA